MRYATIELIVRKYASAFINVFFDELDQRDYDNILAARKFLREQKRALFFLQLPALEYEVKKHGIKTFADEFDLPASVRKLLYLLLEHNRVFLITDILWKITELYKERKDMLTFIISSSHELSTEDISVIKGFLAHLSGKAIMYTYTIDKNLIAGIRLQSTTLLWEYSVRKHLNTIALLA